MSNTYERVRVCVHAQNASRRGRGREGRERVNEKSRLYTLYSCSAGRDLSATYRDVRQNHTDFLDAWLCLRHLVKRRVRGGMSSYHSIGPFETFLRSSQPFVGSHLLILNTACLSIYLTHPIGILEKHIISIKCYSRNFPIIEFLRDQIYFQILT